MQTAWTDYVIRVPRAGEYTVEVRVAVANRDQVLDISNGKTKARIKIPNSYGLWSTTPPVTITLSQGRQVLRVSTPFQRGVTVRWLWLKRKA